MNCRRLYRMLPLKNRKKNKNKRKDAFRDKIEENVSKANQDNNEK